MAERLQNKKVLLTQCQDYMGPAINALFASEGARVVVNARSTYDVDRVVDSINESGSDAFGCVADIGTADGARSLVASLLIRT